jgi:protein-S-isoprenylcysteine O-methyltransferase Ste14
MYLAELALWLGWAVFYGSLTVFLGFWVGGLVFHFLVVPWEERALEARFGEAYIQYRNTVPRWLGLRRLLFSQLTAKGSMQ